MLTTLDQIANQNHLQMIKAMLPYLPSAHQGMLSMLIKVRELQNVASYFRHPPTRLTSCSGGQEAVCLSDMLNDIRNYCDENEKAMIDQISGLLSAMELYSAMAETMSPESFMSGGFPFCSPETEEETSGSSNGDSQNQSMKGENETL